MKPGWTQGALRESLDQLWAGIVHDSEYWGLRAVRIRDAAIALDVGANRGQSIVSLKVLFPDIVIHAFEPNPLFHDCLAKLATRFGESVHIHPYALGRTNGKIALRIPFVGNKPYFEEATTQPEQMDKSWVADRLSRRGDVRFGDLVVDVKAGDELGFSPDLIKIDVEGAELDVLKGLRDTIIRSLPILLIENNDWHGVTPFLAELGYEAFRWDSETKRLVPYYGTSSNSLYIHRSRIRNEPESVEGADGGSACMRELTASIAEDEDLPVRTAVRSRTRILVANFFPAFHPPRSGGEQRYHYLYRHLSRHYDITLLSPTYSDRPFEEIRHGPSFRELRVPKSAAFNRLHWALDAKGIGPECSAYVVSLASALEREYGDCFIRASAEADVIIHESPFTLPYDRSFGLDGKPRIYNAYNIEHRLARQILRGGAGARAVEFIAFLERALARNSALLLATSDEDRRFLGSDFGVPIERIAVAPNGFECDDVQTMSPRPRDQASAVFIGSAHPPNVDGARFVVERLAPALPSIRFRILGAACDKLGAIRLPENVRLHGVVDDVTKRRELAACTLALNPMFAGSGTNLKMLDYLASGAPVVSTPTGARGLDLVDGADAFIAEGDGFVARILQVMSDPALRNAVGDAGQRKALSRFTWEQIANRVHGSIKGMLETRKTAFARSKQRPLLLHVNDFPVVDGVGGGEVRIRELLKELAREFEVVLLCLTNEASRSEQRIGAHVLEIRIPKMLAHRDAEVKAAHGEAVSIDDLLAAEFCTSNDAFLSTLCALAATARVVVFEHPYLSPLLRHLPDDKPIVYSALNVESRLKAQLLRERRDGSHRIEQARDLEAAMVERAALTVCVSEDDRRALRDEFGQHALCVVVENGVRSALRTRATRQASSSQDRFLAIFLGSAHPPNTEAARFLIDTLAPALPRVDIAIVGSVCSALGAMPMPTNVHCLGILSDAEKNGLLARADIALNPLFRGGGSSLKVPDFLASALPMISTRTGVRGYALENGRHYVEAERETFVERTRALLDDPGMRERIAAEARRYATQALDWTALGRRYRLAIDALIGRTAKPRVLVATHRFADPPPGGAETFLAKVLQALHARGNLKVDVATCDVATIADKWHFSAEYGRSESASPTPPYVDSLFRFALDKRPDGDFDRCRRLFRLWMDETRQQARALADELPPLLLGGWNLPERHGDSVRRWTSAESELRIGAATEVRIEGDAPCGVVAEIFRDGKCVASRDLEGRFDWCAAIGTGGPVVSLAVRKTYAAGGDPRELGFIVDAIECNDGATWRTVSLEVDYELAVRREGNERWVRSLIDLTERRASDVDQLSYLVRGPHSVRLAHWLERNVASYDVVLAHGTPFATAVLAAEIAGRHGMPLVCLPHFHMEDRYYHWRFNYEMFRRAHRVIAAPESSKPMFFDPIGAKAIALPGGGVDPDEFRDDVLRAGAEAFARVHRRSAPFVLVLGRKTGAKNYRLAIDAVAELNADRHRVDLVLLGPDEDGVAIDEPHTFCYGAQDRSVVLGALAGALSLVNMSESESFGIVLVESWFAGRPVIARRKCSAFTDLVVDDGNGFLVDTSAELRRAIDRYLRDPVCAKRHAQAGRSIAERHAWSRIAEQIETILLTAANERAYGRFADRTISDIDRNP